MCVYGIEYWRSFNYKHHSFKMFCKPLLNKHIFLIIILLNIINIKSCFSAYFYLIFSQVTHTEIVLALFY